MTPLLGRFLYVSVVDLGASGPPTAWRSSFPVSLCCLQRGRTHPPCCPSSASAHSLCGGPSAGRGAGVPAGCRQPRACTESAWLCRGLGVPRRPAAAFPSCAGHFSLSFWGASCHRASSGALWSKCSVAEVCEQLGMAPGLVLGLKAKARSSRVCVAVRRSASRASRGSFLERPGRGQVLALQCRVARALGDEGVRLPWSRRSRWASQGRGTLEVTCWLARKVAWGRELQAQALGRASGWAGRGSALHTGWGWHRACCRGASFVVATQSVVSRDSGVQGLACAQLHVGSQSLLNDVSDSPQF